MVKFIKCVDNERGFNHITEGKVYEVLREDSTGYYYKGDHGKESWAYKWRFEVVEHKPLPHNHYFIDVGEHLDQETGRCLVDVYVILDKFKVTDPCLQHVAKKALATGNRGHKDIDTDIQDMIDTLERLKEIRSKTR